MSEPWTEERRGAIGDFLGRVHADIRRGLESTLEELDGVIRGGSPTAPAAVALRAQLAMHCIAVCDLLTHHHEHEDDAFGPLERHMPELSPAIARLRQEHHVVAEAIAELRELISGFEAGERTAAEVRDDVARLTADLEKHFAYEEAQLIPPLNRLGEQVA
ncbi:hemerythrin domain-containing protein [Micromonospora sp. B11E3]|uniref:hemerythrin domain-containing protein n=1 Tax=Micromonospora sp. B11E3 TaxID=3153562 RepID=UPI00325E12E4